MLVHVGMTYAGLRNQVHRPIGSVQVLPPLTQRTTIALAAVPHTPRYILTLARPWHPYVFATQRESPPSKSTSAPQQCKTSSRKSLQPQRSLPPSKTVRLPTLILLFPLTNFLRAYSVKAGYPPHPLTLIPELPIESLGLQQGEQLVVNKRSSAGLTHGSAHAPRAAASSAYSAPSPAAPMTGMTASQVRSPVPLAGPGSAKGGGPEYVLTSNGYLIHRVSARMSSVSTGWRAEEC